MSESLRNDGRVWVPKTRELAEKVRKGEVKPSDIPEDERDYYLERIYPSFGNLVPRDVASRNAKNVCDEGRGVGETGLAVYLDFRDAIERDGKDVIKAKYGNLFQMYEKIVAEDPYKVPMMIFPAVHYTMGGLWVDYNLMTTIPGLYATGECNFSDHGANRLGASALMQGLADGYFVIPYTIGDYLADLPYDKVPTDHQAFKEAEDAVRERINRLFAINGKTTVDTFHKKLGKIMWEKCGMSRDEKGLKEAKQEIRQLREEYWKDVRLLGANEELNMTLEKALRVADFMELAELMVDDALDRNESCGGHFREESQTPEGEAKRDDEHYTYVSAWEYKGDGKEAQLHKEELVFENVKLTQRSYK
jgi:succinate dehydrogenase / fumarate reductase flavoprotein subunit